MIFYINRGFRFVIGTIARQKRKVPSSLLFTLNGYQQFNFCSMQKV